MISLVIIAVNLLAMAPGSLNQEICVYPTCTPPVDPLAMYYSYLYPRLLPVVAKELQRQPILEDIFEPTEIIKPGITVTMPETPSAVCVEAKFMLAKSLIKEIYDLLERVDMQVV